MTNYLFVYGTLRRRSRHPMARRLAELTHHVGPARIQGRLYNLGRYPGLQPSQAPDDWVQGDVYDLGEQSAQALQEMDAYENAESPQPAFFDRHLAKVLLADNQEIEVWVYWFRGDVKDEQRIVSGSYEQNCDPEV
jgi:gamma-glutamylcyclotransferase (GGCT)/AIG2-like uncharacterized protein YtfP